MAAFSRPERSWRVVGRLLPGRVILCLAIVGVGASTALAQLGDRSTPSLRYSNGFVPLQEGDYRDALRLFTDEGRGAIKTPQSRWIDSICYEAMIGECYYEMGQLAKALEHYTAAVRLYVAFHDWMLRVQFDPAIRPAAAGALKPTPWGQSAQRFRLGHYPESMLIAPRRSKNNPQ